MKKFVPIPVIFLLFTLTSIAFAHYEHFKIPTATITIDGNMDDWNNIEPVAVDDINDENQDANYEGYDIHKVYLAKDGTFLYCMMTLYDGAPVASGFNSQYGFAPSQYPGEFDIKGDRNCGAFYNTGGWSACVYETIVNHSEWEKISCYPSKYVGVGSNFIEWKVYLEDIGTLNEKFIIFWTNINVQGDSDRNYTYIHIVDEVATTTTPTPTPTPTSSTTPQVSAGSGHRLVLKSDGTVWAWGGNDRGQLGDGGTQESATPIQVSSLNDITSIACGEHSSFALKSDGTVWAWGRNEYGQLGDGTTVDKSTPVQVSGLSSITAIDGEMVHSLALKSDGTVWAWGYNYYGQLGDGTFTDRKTPVQVNGINSVIAIGGGETFSLALKSDGTAWIWGDYGEAGNSRTPVKIGSLSNITAIDGGAWFVLTLKSDGTIWAVGSNESGQLGDRTTTNRETPVQVSDLKDVTAIACGLDFSLAIKSDGTVWSWGLNNYGQLGDETGSNRNTPVQVSGLSDIIDITGGYDHSLALKSDGTVWAWGNGPLGDGTNTGSRTPKQVNNFNVYYTTTSTPTATPTTGTGIIYGSVTDDEGFSFKNVSVSITSTNGYSKSTKTDKEGYYEFTDLAAGDYTLTYEKDGYQTKTQEVSLEEDETLELETIYMERTEKGTISGYVTSIYGDPIESVKLKLKGIRTKAIKIESTDADGFFEFTDLEADDYMITATKKRYKSARKTVTIEEGDATEIEIELRKTTKRRSISLLMRGK